jgi:ABC-type branched-subunit amino acid transport system permease subunit
MELGSIIVYFTIMIGIFAILALGLNVQYGFSGLVNFGHVAFFAIGAYTSAIVTTAGAPFIVGIALAGLTSAMMGFLVALPTSKLSVGYWAITTLGVGEVIRLVALNEEWLTKGSFGIEGIPQPLSKLIHISNYPVLYMCIVWMFVGLLYFLMAKLANSPFGRVLKVIREEEDLALAMGKRVFTFKLKAMALGAAFAGISGSLYAHYITYISPSDFTPIVTFIVWAMVIIGGKGNLVGSIIGAIIIVVFFNSTRYLKDFLHMRTETVASLRMVAIGILVILSVLYKPEGLIKEKKKTYDI